LETLAIAYEKTPVIKPDALTAQKAPPRKLVWSVCAKKPKPTPAPANAKAKANIKASPKASTVNQIKASKRQN
jgi:hypothetical protein